MNVILIAQNFPPKKVIATVRMTEVTNQFVKNGYDVYAFTSYNYKHGPTDKFDLDQRVAVIRSHSWDFLIFWDKFKQLKHKLLGQAQSSDKKATATQALASAGTEFSYRLSEILVYYFPFSLIFGEGSLMYILVTFFKCLRVTRNDSVIFTSFRAYSDHIVGFLLKLVRPKAVWICDFRDAHVPPNAKGWIHRYQTWLNKRLFRRANVVTAVSKGVLSNLDGYNKNMKLLRNGIVGELTFTLTQTGREFFRIVYTGGLYNGTRNPSLLFACLKTMLDEGKIDPAKIRVVYAGSDEVIWQAIVKEHGLEAMSETYGLLPLKEARKLQDSASMNLLLTWCDREYRGVLTGKMYEYFKARRPIITIVNGEKDEEIEDIMRLTNAGPVLYNNSPLNELADFIQGHYTAFLSNEEIKLIDEKALQQFQWDYYFPVFLEELGLKATKTRPKEKTYLSTHLH